MEKQRTAGNLKLLAGHLCLDFTNTLDWRGRENPQEFLSTYHDLVIWCRHADIATREESRQLNRMAEQSASEAKIVLKRAVCLRETIYRIFYAAIDDSTPAKKDLEEFNLIFSLALKDSKIIKHKDGYIWETAVNKTKLDWPLNPVVRSAADLLVSDKLKKVKTCADPACGWLFLDVSRNQKRRWCDMQDCGNRAKASRFYKKKQIL